MRPIYIIGGIAGASLALLLIAKKAKSLATVNPRDILALGDSLTASKDYCKALSTDSPPGGTVSCRGLPGKGTGAILSDLITLYPGMSLDKFTDVVVLAGVNDIASGRGVLTVTHNLDSIYSYIHNSGARVIAVQLTPWYSYKYNPDWQSQTEEVNQWIAASSADFVVSTYELGDFQSRLLDQYSAGDGLHLNQQGSQKLAQLVIQQGVYNAS